MKNTVLKSIGAVIAGLLANVVLGIGTDYLMESAGVFPSFREQAANGLFIWWMLLIALIYRMAYGVVGSYLTAALAPDRPMRHAIILGCIGVVIGILGGFANADKSSAWYPIALVIVTLPVSWLGGRMRVNYLQQRAQ